MILAIDCALRRINLAAGESAEDAVAISIDSGAKQAEALPGAVDDVLRERGASLSDVDAVAVSRGPGFYTGIRVGVSYAAALAYAIGAQVAPVSTLDAMASPASGDRAAIIRARRGAVYAAVYGESGRVGCEKFVETDALDAELLERYGERGIDVLYAGFDEPPPMRAARTMIDASSSVPMGMMIASERAKRVAPSEVRAVYLREPNG